MLAGTPRISGDEASSIAVGTTILIGGTSTRVLFDSANTVGESANFTYVSPALTLGVAGSTTGQLKLTGATSGTVTITPNAVAGTVTLTLPATTGTVITTGDTGTVTNTMLAGSIDLTTKVTGALPPANGGTGVANNAASTLTISGNFATTLTVTAGTSVTLPTSGTLVSSVATANGVSASNSAGALTFSLGAISPSSITGTVTNDSAAAGKIGEVLSATIATGSAVALTTATTANVITTLSLTAGDWDVTGVVDFTFGATTSVTYLAQGISSVTATLGAQDTFSGVAVAAMVIGSAKDMSLPTPTVRISLASTQTIYLVAQAVFTVSTCSAYGTIRARRQR